MKKVVLSISAMLFGAVCLAQNTSLVTQTGPNFSTVTQTGANLSTVLQGPSFFGAPNVSTVTQVGTNISSVDQQGFFAFSGGNSAVVNQNGTVNNSSVYQRGTAQTGIATQVGKFNTSIINQPFGVGNLAQHTQMSGNYNIAESNQYGFNNKSFITQSGNGNWAQTNQLKLLPGAGHLSVVTQSGGAWSLTNQF